MPVAQPLKKLDIDGTTHLVEDMSEKVQLLVSVYNEWNQDLLDARTKFAQMQAAVQVAHQQLNDQIRTEYQEQVAGAAAAAEAQKPAPALDAKAEAEQIAAEEAMRQQMADEAPTVEEVATEERFPGIAGQTD